MKLIIGLGNPGPKYEKVRHNLGFMVVDEFIKKMDGGRWKIGVEDRNWKVEKKFKSEILRGVYTERSRSAQDDKEEIVLVKPQTYMNNSGLAVKLLTTNYQLPTTNLIVIHDDLDLPLGKIKIRLGGAAAGHHGVESIINSLGTDKFIRVRLGIGNLRTQSSEHKHAHVDAEKFVLQPFMHSEKSKVKHMIKQVTHAIELLLEKGLPIAQNQYN
ncbi:MAG: aminoacyl-tRNA hydrolase [Patescibacteria group bacterium]